MKDRFDILVEIIEKSVEKNGDCDLTTFYFLNILKKVNRQYENQIEEEWEWAKLKKEEI